MYLTMREATKPLSVGTLVEAERDGITCEGEIISNRGHLTGGPRYIIRVVYPVPVMDERRGVLTNEIRTDNPRPITAYKHKITTGGKSWEELREYLPQKKRRRKAANR